MTKLKRGNVTPRLAIITAHGIKLFDALFRWFPSLGRCLRSGALPLPQFRYNAIQRLHIGHFHIHVEKIGPMGGLASVTHRLFGNDDPEIV
ncbi:MAG: hypothetical protein V1262_00080 [Alphaproteobacteria bacterium]|nr:hypothetical protein [Alphaproteobacteria bacterium]